MSDSGKRLHPSPTQVAKEAWNSEMYISEDLLKTIKELSRMSMVETKYDNHRLAADKEVQAITHASPH